MSEEIIVRGQGQARAMPDRALVNVKLEGEMKLCNEIFEDEDFDEGRGD
jgi:hypothetical protein